MTNQTSGTDLGNVKRMASGGNDWQGLGEFARFRSQYWPLKPVPDACRRIGMYGELLDPVTVGFCLYYAVPVAEISTI